MSAPDAASPPRHVLITGAARGIGAAIATRLAQGDVHLSLVGRTRETLDRFAASLPARARPATFACDVADAASVASAFAAARAAHGPIAILVNNAGQAQSAPLARTSDELWQRMLAVNLTGTFNCTREALPDLLAAGAGRIVNIASTAGQRGYAYVAAYAAAKHGVIGLTRSLALEVAARGITVNAVCPGYTDTDLLAESVANVVAKTGRSNEEARAGFAATSPIGRVVDPREVAEAVAWLCSDAAAAVTGQSISVSGGEVM